MKEEFSERFRICHEKQSASPVGCRNGAKRGPAGVRLKGQESVVSVTLNHIK